MKKIFSFITALMVATTMFAQDALFTQTYPGNPSSYVSGYTASFTVTTGDYTLTYANINNGQAKDSWDVIRAGRKNVASVATITSGQLSEAISKVAINFTEVNASLTNSLKLKVADNADFTGATEVGADIVAGLVEFAIETPAADMYYQIEIDQASGSANGFNRFNSVAFYEAEAGEEPGDEPGENVLSGALSGTEATYSFEYEFATTEDMQLEVTGLLEITGEVVGMVPQIFINNAYAGNFTYDAGVCSFTSADAYEAGAELDIYFYFAYAGGATATDHVSYTIEAQGGDEPEPVAYYIKSKWAEDATDWTWQPMTEESEGVWVYDGTFYGTGVNINTKADDNGAVWYPLGEAYEGHQLDGEIEAGQNVHFVYNVEAGTVTATAIVEPVVELNTCAEVNAAAANTEIALGAVQVIYVNGKYTYVQDATGTALLYKDNLGLTVGQIVEGIEGKVTIYKGLPELVPSNALADWTVTEGAEVVYDVWTAETAPTVEANINQIYTFMNVSYNDGAVFSDATVTVYNKFNVEPAMENDHIYNFVGIVTTFNGIQLYPIAVEDVTPDTPVEFDHELYGSEELPAIGKTWFANTGWEEETNSHAEIVNDYDVNVVLVDAKAGQWQSQVFVNPGFTWEVGAYYKMEFDLTTNHQLGGVHVKVNNNNDNYFYDSYPNDNLFLADQTTHFVADSIYAMAEPTDGGQLIFSVGWCDANTEILISNIVITKYEAPVVEDAFTITVENIAAASADITVTPADDNIAYYWNFTKAESFDIAQIGKSNLDSYIEYLTSLYAQYGMEMEFTYADIATKGADSYSATSLDPATEYVVYAFGYDTITGELTTAVATQSFTTVTVPASENVITLTYDTKLNITTTNTDDYMVLIELKEDYDNYEPDMTQASLNAEVDSWDFQDPSARILSGNQSVDPASYYISETQGAVVEAGKEYIALVYPYSTEDGVRNGDVVALVFTYVVPVTALENIELVEKTTKVVSDGQVLIIRDAKMFNVLGARIR